MKFTENDITYFVMLIDNAMDDTIDEISILMITSLSSKINQNKNQLHFLGNNGVDIKLIICFILNI